MSEIMVQLSHPIKAHGETINELKLARPNFGALMQLDSVKGDLAKAGKLIEICAKIPASSVAQLDVEDVAKVTEALAPFFATFQQIGGSAE